MILQMKKVIFIFLALMSTAFSIHKFYVSTTSIKYIPNERSLQITAQVFADDFESTLKQHVQEIRLNPDNKVELIDSLTKKYFQKNLVFKTQDGILSFDYLGKVYRNDLLVAYLEIVLDGTVQNLVVQNTLLFDFSEDQKNILHFRNAGKRKSFLSVPSNNRFNIEINSFQKEP